MTASCAYEGWVRHRRHEPVAHELRMRLFMLYLDLDELPALFDRHPLWSARRPALAWFRRSDYLGDPREPLRESVLGLVRQRTGLLLDGPVRLLTQLRYFGHCFNPVSFYYCFDRAGECLRAVVAEVTNTPWGERHAYVLTSDEQTRGPVMRAELRKALHVSPLMGMDHTYDWRLTQPDERLSLHIAATPVHGEPVFDATLSLRRHPISNRQLRRVLLRYPLPTLRLTARIYSHALRLRLRGARWHPHPRRPSPEGLLSR